MKRLIPLLLVLCLVVAACGNSSPSPAPTTTTTIPPISDAVLTPDFAHELPNLADGLPVPFSYLLRHAETAYATEIGQLFWMALGNAHANFDYPERSASQWSVDTTQKIRMARPPQASPPGGEK